MIQEHLKTEDRETIRRLDGFPNVRRQPEMSEPNILSLYRKMRRLINPMQCWNLRFFEWFRIATSRYNSSTRLRMGVGEK